VEEKYVLSGVYKYLSRRIRTEHEIRQWMDRKEVPEELQGKVIKKLIELKLLNDFEYACSFVRTRNLIKPKPKKVITLELLRKGIDKQTIHKALQEIGVDEVAAAKLLFEKNKWRWESLEESTKKRKAQEFLARKGFGWDVLKNVVGVS
jgi:regulatory protein